MHPRFEVFEGKDGQFYFRLKARNGKIICQSEGYTRRVNVLKGIDAIIDCAPGAMILQK